jgi:ubiquitin carboxyl-terminal hydrolase 14
MDVDSAPAASGSVTSKVDELSVRQKEKRELEALLDKDLAGDVGANATGVYELMGVVSHKGASADGGALLWWSSALF